MSGSSPNPHPPGTPASEEHHLGLITRVDAVFDRLEDEAIEDAAAAVAAAPTSPLRQLAGFMRAKARRVVVAIVGSTVLLAGLAMMVLPGPGVLVIIAGLGILGTEFVWARKALDIAKDRAQRAKDAAVSSANRGRVAVLTAAAVSVAALVAAWWFGLRT